MSEQAVIVGGGLAGLAAAVALSDKGVPVTLLESRPRLGGRAGSFFDKLTGEWIDACQHVSLGCCTNLEQFCGAVGIGELFQTPNELTFIDPDGRRSHLRSRWLPAPLHLTMGGARTRLSDWKDRSRIGSDLRRLAHPRWASDEGLSFLDWLGREGTTLDLREQFWDVILISALSESLDRISVPYARKVFVDGFLANRRGWRVRIPRAPLEELYGRRVTEFLATRRSNVRLQSGVERLESDGERITAVRLRSGESITGDEFIMAVPWHRVLDLLSPQLAEHPDLTGVRALEAAPISSVHLWFDRPVIDVPHAVLVGRLGQWVFRKVEGRKLKVEGDTTSYLQVVISASRSLAGRSREEVIGEVVRELGEIWPNVRSAKLRHERLVTEHRAVFSPVPGVDRLRPGQQSPIGNLQLAGDWTQTGWPATMEGAVRSGYLAAENVLHRLGRPASLVQPDLPVGRLARWMLGIHSSRRLARTDLLP